MGILTPVNMELESSRQVPAKGSRKEARKVSGRGRSPRSRSPKRAFQPQLKEWVLTRVSSRLWRDAVPAMVSKVSEGESGVRTVCLAVPNLLALRHGFPSKMPFREINDVQLLDVRTYGGSDQPLLRSLLLRAIEKVVHERRSQSFQQRQEELSSKLFEHALEFTKEVNVASLQIERHRGEDEAASDPESEAEAAEAPGFAVPPEPTTMPTMSTLRREARTSPLEVSPATPPKRQLCRQDTPPTPQEVETSGRQVVSLQAPSKAQDTRWLLDFTRAVAQSFKQTQASEMSQQELLAAMGKSFSSEDLKLGLQQLEDNNKVFLTGDLVFLV